MIRCCKDCKERHPICHSECERYMAEKAAYAKNTRTWNSERVMFEYDYDKTTKIQRKMKQ